MAIKYRLGVRIDRSIAVGSCPILREMVEHPVKLTIFTVIATTGKGLHFLKSYNIGIEIIYCADDSLLSIIPLELFLPLGNVMNIERRD